jgi:hypothetical protein
MPRSFGILNKYGIYDRIDNAEAQSPSGAKKQKYAALGGTPALPGRKVLALTPLRTTRMDADKNLKL